MSAKNYFKDGGSWIKGELVVGGKAFCMCISTIHNALNAVMVEFLLFIANSWKVGLINMVFQDEFNSKVLS